MSDTKENILQTALRLFARDGYEAVSVSMIAGELGVTKGALYKHYANKQAILDAIVERIYQLDREQARKSNMPEETREQSFEAYTYISVQQLETFALEQFRFLTEDGFAAQARRLLILEQYRNTTLMDLYQRWLVTGPLNYLEDIFREMMRRGIVQEEDAELLALEFYAPLYLLLSAADAASNNTGCPRLLLEHIKYFTQKHMIGSCTHE